MAKKRIFTEEQEKEIINFYLIPNTLNDTSLKFKVDSKVLDKIFNKYNIKKHSKEVFLKLQQAKIKNTCIEKYGVTNVFATEEVKQKIKETNLERRGVEYAFQSEEVKQKIDQTNILRYGDKRPSRTAIIQERIKETNREKYGVDWNQQNPEIKQKSINTTIDKYGVPNVAMVPEIMEKATKNAMATKLLNNTVTVSHKYEYMGDKFDSLHEIIYYLWKKSQNIQIKRNKEIFLEYYTGNKIHRYFPDFIENGNFVEVKGEHLIDKITGQLICPFEKGTEQDMAIALARCKAKFDCMLMHKVIGISTINVSIWKDDIIKAQNWIVETYGEDYITKLNIIKIS